MSWQRVSRLAQPSDFSFMLLIRQELGQILQSCLFFYFYQDMGIKQQIKYMNATIINKFQQQFTISKLNRFLSISFRQIYLYIQKMKSCQTIALLTLISIITCSLQIYSPECSVKKKPEMIEYTLSNFGQIPYGEQFIGQIRLPNKQDLCTTEGQSVIVNRKSQTRVIILVKRGGCKFTQKVINAQNIGADVIIIYDNQKGDKPQVIMKNDGHGHLARIPSLFISNTDGLILKSKECSELAVVKIKFKIQQAQISHVIFWLDAANRESYILARDFYKNDYFKVLQKHVKLDIRFKVENTCNNLIKCDASQCYQGGKNKYCRSAFGEQGASIKGKDLLSEQLRQYFLWQRLGEEKKIVWWQYMTKFDHQDCIQTKDIEDCSYTMMKNVGVGNSDIESIKSSMIQTAASVKQDKVNILETSLKESRQLGIYFFPQATINDRNFYGLFKAPQVFQTICESLLSPPKQCITFIKNNHQIDTEDETTGIWKSILIIVTVMTAGFLAALCIYTGFIRKEVDQQLSLEVNKMVENYVNLAEKKKGSSGSNGSYSKMEE